MPVSAIGVSSGSNPDGASSEGGYTVRSGDTLWGIAQAHGVSLQALEAANPQIANDNLIYAGQHVSIPPAGASTNTSASAPRTYTVQAGDTLSAIGQRFGVDWRLLAQVNGLSNPNLIYPGETLNLGGGASQGSGGAQGAGGVQSGSTAPGSSGKVYDIARSYLGQTSGALKTDTHDSLPMDPNCPSGECCANFVSAVLVQAGQLPASLHTDSVAQLKSTLESRGWTPVSAAQAQPGDVVIMQGGGISHTEIAAGNGQMIGSNNTSGDSQTVSYNSLSYAESHGGIILRAPGGAAGGSAPAGGAGAVGAPAASTAGREQQAVSYFESQGWSHAQAAGIVANLTTESRLSPSAVGDGGSAYGLGQWHPDRQQTFEQAFGHPIQGSSFDQQLQFVQYELTHTESSAGGRLRSATSAGEAGSLVSLYYERPADASGEAASRATLANQIFAQTH